MKRKLFYDGIFHSGVGEKDTFSCMEVTDGRITGIYDSMPEGTQDAEKISLAGQHVYPCLIDGHLHLLFTIVNMGMGFSVCETTKDGVSPNTMAGVEEKIRSYAAKQKKGAVIAASNYILSAIDERRLPTRFELDEWAGGRPVVVYNIDGHCSALSTEMMKRIGLDPEGSDGILSGEVHERNQGKLTDAIGASVTLSALARGIGQFHNTCAQYGITVVGALEGNGDSAEDKMTELIVRLARHFDVGVRFYYQYLDINKAKKLTKYQRRPRIGGCGDWEMDGAVGAHSAAFSEPFRDTGKTSPCYYFQEQVDAAVQKADENGFQIAGHAIGDRAIERIVKALDLTTSGNMHRIEHCEFLKEHTLEMLISKRYAVMMQPGYSWIDKRYLHTYSQFLPEDIIRELKFRSLYDAGICVCGSSDSPVQDIDPYMQMQGMVQFYIEEESVTPYEAFQCYTSHPARAILEEGDYGTLEVGKKADFFTAKEDFFGLDRDAVRTFRPTQTYYGGEAYVRKKGTVFELIKMMLKKGRPV